MTDKQIILMLTAELEHELTKNKQLTEQLETAKEALTRISSCGSMAGKAMLNYARATLDQLK